MINDNEPFAKLWRGRPAVAEAIAGTRIGIGEANWQTATKVYD